MEMELCTRRSRRRNCEEARRGGARSKSKEGKDIAPVVSEDEMRKMDEEAEKGEERRLRMGRLLRMMQQLKMHTPLQRRW